MSRYDGLDARSELEQTVAEDLESALKKRRFEVRHNGTKTQPAKAGLPDIEVWNAKNHINVEVTKTTKSSSDREYLAIKDHLDQSKEKHPNKSCFVWYISPETHYRMMGAMRAHNLSREDIPDLVMMPVCFSTFELFVGKLVQATKDEYKAPQIVQLFSRCKDFADDESVLRIFYEELFPTDNELRKRLEAREDNRHQTIVQDLIRDLTRLEQDLRDYRIALSTDAIKNVIYLVFIKLYEEKREYEGKENRFTKETFLRFQEYAGQEEKKLAIHELFKKIRDDPELRKANLFTDMDRLSEKLKDDFVVKYFIEPFSQYHFYTTKVDGLGAAYEVLGKLSGKDVKVGQFFTPEYVVKFMVKLAGLESTDIVLDPACGTGRFLIYAMEDMLSRVTGVNVDKQKKNVKTKQLLGSDDDTNVAKLAKMNMYIHGDGKANIFDRDGLLLSDFDKKIDVVLTNPPLGNLTYMKDTYDDDFRLKRMETIPRKNQTEESLTVFEERLVRFREKLKEAKKTEKKVKYFEKKVKEYEEKVSECRLQIRDGKEEYKTTGNLMKGGALFVNATKHYLKDVRDEDALPEWRGGKLLIILDEGILNTDNYRQARQFIRTHFYIKAVISLTKDAFVPVSNTTTKTSILYAIKKEDPDAIQKEPVFFAHAEKVGINTRKKTCPNHLYNDRTSILSKYSEFKKCVLESYDEVHFNRERFLEHGFEKGIIG
ncbi:MAG: N-6 DNA methylase [Thermoplasmata archaeon]|nr:N-6 DNA methylase [Thermoplasmata archaeon]